MEKVRKSVEEEQIFGLHFFFTSKKRFVEMSEA